MYVFNYDIKKTYDNNNYLQLYIFDKHITTEHTIYCVKIRNCFISSYFIIIINYTLIAFMLDLTLFIIDITLVGRFNV